MPLRERSVGIRCLLLLGVLALAATPALAQDSPSEAQMRKDIFFLASEQCEGRGEVAAHGAHGGFDDAPMLVEFELENFIGLGVRRRLA